MKLTIPKHWPVQDPKAYKPLDWFIPYDKNPRTHPAEQIELLGNLIVTHGPDQPIVVDENRVILKGHGRLTAAQTKGIEVFTFVQHTGLSELDKRAIRIADNQVALLAGWNQQLIRAELSDLKLSGYDLPLLGFPEVELVQFMTGLGPDQSWDQSSQSSMSLSERFGLVPFSVFNAREGWWQDRKRAWIALGIQSELGRGENLIERSPQELFCHLTGISYDKARKIVVEAMEREGDKFNLQELVKSHGGRKQGRKPNAVPGGGTDAAGSR